MTKFTNAETGHISAFKARINHRNKHGSAFAYAKAKFWLDQRHADVKGEQPCSPRGMFGQGNPGGNYRW